MTLWERTGQRRCRSCKAAVIWAAAAATGRRMPFDAEPSTKGEWVLDDADGGEGLAGSQPLVALHIPDDPGERYVPHWATCPQAGSWRT